jgi:ATP/maltotriose-dependent transcriptional regulator MalT
MASEALDVTKPAAHAVADFLACASKRPCGLILEGEAGIGKTTFWLGVQEQAREHGFQVLSARPAAAETVLAYAVVADLLASVDPVTWMDLPLSQQLAIDRVMLSTTENEIPANPRAVAAAFLAVIEKIAGQQKLVLALDDLQWVDPSSASAIAFAARRMSGPIGIVGAVRTRQTENPGTWLQLHRPDAVRRMVLAPMSLGALHKVVSDRLGRSFTRPTMVRIHEISGGNPFYAIELARGIADGSAATDMRLPPTLAELVHTRVGSLDSDTQDLLLAAACLGEPTVELLVSATEQNSDRLQHLIEEVETAGILVLDGYRVRFSHPLLANGVYTGATPADRRRMHRRLADLVSEPELHARHLALAATQGDPATLESLDRAAETARIRGAPAAAAELLDLAIGLGGDTAARRILSATDHFSAGDPGRARAILEETIRGLPPGRQRADAVSLLAVMGLLNGIYPETATLLKQALEESGENHPRRAQVLIALSFARLNFGQLNSAARSIEDSVSASTRLNQPHLLSQALGIRALIRCMQGHGIDEEDLRRAVELEGSRPNTPAAFRPRLQNAILRGWAGDLTLAHDEMRSIRRSSIERGEDNELIYAAFHSVLIEVWRADFIEATNIAEDAAERALQLGGDLPDAVALTVQGLLAAYAGREDVARSHAAKGLAASQRCGSSLLASWPIVTLGFLEVSLGNYGAALHVLEPLRSSLDEAATEIFTGAFLPDAVEAMVQLGQLDAAEPLIDALEQNGRRLDRSWMLAIAARGRAMLLAARGDLTAAVVAAESAMVEHDRLPMPFERARTQLLLGQLQRRRRMKSVAAATLQSAQHKFEELGTPLWTERARAELARVKVGPQSAGELSASEQRVAELAASGMTIREVGAAMAISPKTVESNLARVYRKLGIRSRAELGRLMGRGVE